MNIISKHDPIFPLLFTIRWWLCSKIKWPTKVVYFMHLQHWDELNQHRKSCRSFSSGIWHKKHSTWICTLCIGSFFDWLLDCRLGSDPHNHLQKGKNSKLWFQPNLGCLFRLTIYIRGPPPPPQHLVPLQRNTKYLKLDMSLVWTLLKTKYTMFMTILNISVYMHKKHNKRIDLLCKRSIMK